MSYLRHYVPYAAASLMLGAAFNAHTPLVRGAVPPAHPLPEEAVT